MKILLDTNVLLDVLMERETFFQDSYSSVEKAIVKGDVLCISASCITDIFYIIKKYTKSKEKALMSIKKLLRIASVLQIDESHIVNALYSKINDYEDAIIDEISYSNNINIIITRNIKDFKNSKTDLVLSPREYIDNY